MTGNKCLLQGLLLCLFLPLKAVAEGTVYFLYDNANPQHLNYVSDSERLLRKALPELDSVRLSLARAGVLATVPEGRTLVITVGSSAARLAIDSGLPTLNTMITRRHFQSIKGTYESPVTALYLEQPFSRMLTLVKTTLPDRKQITVILGLTSRLMQEEINVACQAQGLRCTSVVVKDQAGLEQAQQFAASTGKVMLVLPDPQVVNASTARNLILGAYRRGVALVGYSSALVKAGALMSVHSTPGQLGEDAAAMAIEMLQRGSLNVPPARYPERYNVSVNYQLARALQLDLATEASLTNAIEKAERNE